MTVGGDAQWIGDSFPVTSRDRLVRNNLHVLFQLRSIVTLQDDGDRRAVTRESSTDLLQRSQRGNVPRQRVQAGGLLLHPQRR